MREENVKKDDRRSRRTKKLLLHALTKLMEHKKPNEISVKELTDLADLNRSTFYLYYQDIYDMLEQLEKEFLDDFNKAFEMLLDKSPSYDVKLNFYTHIIEYVKDNIEICRVTLSPDGDSRFVENFKEALLKLNPPFLTAIPKEKLHYLRHFILSGCIGAIQKWIRDDMPIEPKELAVIITQIIHVCTVNLSEPVDFKK